MVAAPRLSPPWGRAYRIVVGSLVYRHENSDARWHVPDEHSIDWGTADFDEMYLWHNVGIVSSGLNLLLNLLLSKRRFTS